MNPHPRRGTTVLARVAAFAVVTAGLTALSAPAQAAAPDTEAAAPRATSNVNGATFTWGLSGYAQKGIFGPWTYKNLTGNVSQLTGSVSNGTQTDYVVSPVPATSMPVSDPQKTPNAIKFTAGVGTADPATGATHLTWDGSYTVNAYPAQYNAPDEVYSDPELTIAADGSGTMTMDLTIGAGVDMTGNPTPAVDLGRLAIMTYSAGSDAKVSDNAYRYTPDYNGNVVTDLPADGSPQTTTCSTDGGATGWAGAWPDEFVNAVPASIRPHFYSTGCGGMQDNKPALPVDVTFDQSGSVTVSDVTLLPNGTQQVTVTGSGFDPELAIGTRPPFQGSQSGVYIAYGRYLDVWRPTQNAPTSSRTNPAGANGTGVAVKWAVPAASFPGPFNQDPTAASYTELKTDGTFSTTISVDQSWLASAAGNFGIYTYAGGGPTVASYETYTPITFAAATPDISIVAPSVTVGTAGDVAISVASEAGNTGSIDLLVDDAPVGTVALLDGTAAFSLPADLAVGDHELGIYYAPDNANIAPATATATFTVDPFSSTVSLVSPARTYGQAATATVSLVTPGSPVGTVTLTSGDVEFGTADLVDSGATFALGKLAAGSYPLTATFSGNATTAASSVDVVLKVAKAVTATKVAVTKKPTVKKAGKAKVTVTSPTTTPNGKATVKVKNAKGKVVKTVTVKLTNGVGTFALPKGAAGKYSVVATYVATANITKSTKTVTYKIA